MENLKFGSDMHFEGGSCEALLWMFQVVRVVFISTFMLQTKTLEGTHTSAHNLLCAGLELSWTPKFLSQIQKLHMNVNYECNVRMINYQW